MKQENEPRLVEAYRVRSYESEPQPPLTWKVVILCALGVAAILFIVFVALPEWL